MNYFGGLGAGKGWHTVMLFLTTALLSELLTSCGLRLFFSAKRDPADYQSTIVTEHLVGFQSYLNLVSRGELPDWHQHWQTLPEQMKTSTRSLVVTNGAHEIRTRMRISQGAIPAANAHHPLQRPSFKTKATDRRRPSDT